MNIYPALRAAMGTWNYFIVKMQMKDLVKEVGFASEIYENKTLDDAIQRSLNEGRVKSEIVKYLGLREDRFFSSIVVAALDGNPTFMPVDIAEDPKFQIFRAARVDDAFGVLTFDGGQKYYALDGQHRLKAIKTLIEQKEGGLPSVPENFENEEISVVMLIKGSGQGFDEFMRGYRRVFSALNRYAKATDKDTNIIMDEDDAIAILTRRLLTDYSFFEWSGRPSDSPKLKTKGKNIRSGDSFFTSLQTLYAMNQILLKTPSRERTNYGSKEYQQVRPSEEGLDRMFDELTLYWDSLLEEIPDLKNDPTRMREHAKKPTQDDVNDSLLFWPIGQELFVKVVRILLNRRLPDTENPTIEEVRRCISPLAELNWELHSPPWRGLLLVYDQDKKSWKMRNESRKEALEVAQKILLAQVGLIETNDQFLKSIRLQWSAGLVLPKKESADDHWPTFRRSFAT